MKYFVSLTILFLPNIEGFVKIPCQRTNEISHVGFKSESVIDTVDEYDLSTSSSQDVMLGSDQSYFLAVKGTEIAKSYEPGESFNPPNWATRANFQTIVGGLFRSSTMYYTTFFDFLQDVFAKESDKDDPFIRWDERRRYETSDGDFFDTDWKFSIGECKGTVVLIHGLESSSDQELTRDMATANHLNGFNTVCINFRGCSGEANRTPGGYHLSFTDDLRFFLNEFVKKNKQNQPIYLSGFSLGANVVANFLAEEGDNAFFKYNVHGAAINSLPVDITQTTNNINGRDSFSSFVYGTNLLEKLRNKSLNQVESGMDLPFTAEDLNACQTVMDIENTVICPLYGFADAEDYYRKSSVYHRLSTISIPLYILNASDDPFFTGDRILNGRGPVKVEYTKYGGHCGNILHEVDANFEWDGIYKSSWMPNELARFILHTHECWDSTTE